MRLSIFYAPRPSNFSVFSARNKEGFNGVHTDPASDSHNHISNAPVPFSSPWLEATFQIKRIRTRSDPRKLTQANLAAIFEGNSMISSGWNHVFFDRFSSRYSNWFSFFSSDVRLRSQHSPSLTAECSFVVDLPASTPPISRQSVADSTNSLIQDVSPSRRILRIQPLLQAKQYWTWFFLLSVTPDIASSQSIYAPALPISRVQTRHPHGDS